MRFDKIESYYVRCDFFQNELLQMTITSSKSLNTKETKAKNPKTTHHACIRTAHKSPILLNQEEKIAAAKCIK